MSAIRKYKKSWEEEAWAKGWLIKSQTSLELEAFCKVCKIELRAHQADLKKHSSTKNHLKNMKKMNPDKNKQSVLPNIFLVSDGEKLRDLQLAIHIAMHNSIRSTDHLCDLLKKLGKGSQLESLQLHRTKCTGLIKNVISPYLLEEIVPDIGTHKYALIIDESTDISVFKYLCFCVKYYSERQKIIVTDYLGMTIVEETSANALTEHIKKFLDKVNLKIENLVGLGTDGASNLCGKHHSVYTLLKKQIPNLQLVRCVCHSLNNVSNKAAEELPTNIEFLCSEIYNFFNCSPLRRSTYKKTFDLINSGSDGKQFSKFIQISTTRWLSRYKCVKIITEHWLELKTHFEFVVNSEKCYTSRLIAEMLNDNKNYLLLLIIKPILNEMNNTNLIFQRDTLDVGKAYDTLCSLLFYLARKIFKEVFLQNDVTLIIQNLKNHLAYKEISDCDYGVEYYQAALKLNINAKDKFFVEHRAFKYIQSLCIELCERLPTSLNHFRKLKVLSPECCLTQLQCKFVDLPFLKEFCQENNFGIIETQWNKIRDNEWQFSSEKNDMNLFWCQVYNFKDAGESFCYRNIAEFVVTLLTLPTSNAVVERVFSVMNTIKTKLRNKMSFELLDAIIKIRLYLYSRKYCCDKLVIPHDMLKIFVSNIMYDSKPKQEHEESELNNCIDEIIHILDDSH